MERARRSWSRLAVGDLVGQRVLERVLELREEAASRRGTRRPAGGRARAAAPPPGSSAIACSSANGTSLPITAADCSRRLSSGGSRSMRAARIACTVAGTWMARIGSRQAIGPALADQRLRSPPGSARSPRGRTGCPRCARSASRLSGCSAGIVAEQRVQQLLGALRRQADRAGAGV